MEPVHKEFHGKYILTVEYDDQPSNPREWDNTFTLVARKHRNYMLGDEQVDSLDEYLEGLDDKDSLIILPWYIYDHGNVAFSTKPFGCRFDSALAGVAYCKKTDIANHSFKDKDLSEEDKALLILQGELDTFQAYANGECYSYSIYEKYTDERGNDQTEYMEGCGSYYSIEDAIEAGLESLDYFQAQDNRSKTEEQSKKEEEDKLHSISLDIVHAVIDYIQEKHKIHIRGDEFVYMDDSVRYRAVEMTEIIKPKLKEFKCSL